ncbi:MAG: ATP phosphoribosyltransferase regulatory subunit [Bauldia sp.]
METPVDRLRNVLEDAGYSFVEPPLLHDADLFLDLAGEDLRRRMYLTASADGVELCLRPDYTIPVALQHLTKGGDPKRVAAYAYCGPVFRQRPGETGEFWQAGVESIGRSDIADADADILALAIEGVAVFDVREPAIRIGDSALFEALLDALPLPDVWRRRLARAFGDRPRIDALLDELSGRTVRPRPAQLGMEALDKLAGRAGALDEATIRSHVEEVFQQAGLPMSGGRTPAEIVERFVEQAELDAGSDDGRAAAETIRRFLEIAGPPTQAALALGELAQREGLDIGAAVGRFAERTHGLVRHGIDIDRIRFAADFGRRLDYYTGFVFELSDPARPEQKPLAGGGRYDHLLSLIRSRNGTGTDVPAVGVAFWLDRLGARTP